MRNSFIKTFTTVAEENPDVWLLCGDLGYSVLEPFATRFPERYVNIGVAEQNMAGIAAGIALSGKTVFIYSIGNFPTLRCLEQIRNDICYHGADVKIVAVGAGFAYGSQGYTHHAIEDVGILSTLPGLEVFVPCDPREVEIATRTIAASRRPSYLRLSRAGEPALTGDGNRDVYLPTVLREGDDVLLLTSGPIALEALRAAEELVRDNITTKVVSVTCLKPFPDATLEEMLESTRVVVTLEEHILRGGLHAAVSAMLARRKEHPLLLGLGIPEPVGKVSAAGDRDVLLRTVGLDSKAIAQRIRQILRAD